ncbi:MAG: PorV/PorQ family protein [candidate division KSB1 bacterium]|nr:PorV/PorQ family protein [candidate division KSB1 bacterium]
MKKFTVIVALVVIGAYPMILAAQENTRVGTCAAQFLKLGVGARAAALGESGTATPGITGLYWNPAAVAAVDRLSAFFAYSSMYAGLSHNFLGLAYPLGAGNTVGVGITYMTSDRIEITTVDMPEGTGAYYSLSNYAVSLTFARYMTDRLSLGVSAKFIQEGIYREKARTVALDLGSLLDTGLLGIKLAMSLSNFGGNMRLSGPDLRVSHERWPEFTGNPSRYADLSTEVWPLPMIFRMGISSSLVGMDGQLAKSASNEVTVYADATDTNDSLLRSNFGIEYVWNNIVALRAGYRGLVLAHDEHDTYNTSSYAAGAGLHYGVGGLDLTLDYAYTDYQILGNTQQLSVTIRF